MGDQLILHSWPSETVIISPPVNLLPEDHSLFQHEFQWDLPDVHLQRADRCVATFSGIVYSGFSALAFSFARGSARRKIWSLAASIPQRLNSFSGPSSALWITDFWSSNYFHWMTDALGRLLLAQEAGVSSPVLLPLGLAKSSFIRGSLDVLGVKAIEIPPGRSVIVRELFIPDHPSISGRYRPTLLRELSNRLCAPREKRPDRRIYLSRSEARFRRIANEDALIPVLERHGFEMYSFDSLQWSEQRRILSECSVLASIHGAGLTGMLMQPPGSTVLEIRMESDSHNNAYYSMASVLGHKYLYLKCRPSSSGTNAHTADLYVDPAELGKVLALMEAHA